MSPPLPLLERASDAGKTLTHLDPVRMAPDLGTATKFFLGITEPSGCFTYTCLNPPQELPWRNVMKFPSGRGETVRVLVADSNQIQSQLLSGALRRQANFKVTCCRTELDECLSALETSPADVVIVGNGVHERAVTCEIIRGIHSAFPKLAIVLLVDSYDRELVVDAMRNGARGLFCLNVHPFKALCRCIASVYSGQIWANAEQMRYVLEALANPTAHVVNARGDILLTEREEQVVSLVAEGISNREIAEQLGVKENTIKKCLLRVYDKLGVCNRVELVLYALSHRASSSPEMEANYCFPDAPNSARTSAELKTSSPVTHALGKLELVESVS